MREGDGGTRQGRLCLPDKVMADSRMGVATEYRHQKRQRFIVKQGLFLHLTPACLHCTPARRSVNNGNIGAPF